MFISTNSNRSKSFIGKRFFSHNVLLCNLFVISFSIIMPSLMPFVVYSLKINNNPLLIAVFPKVVYMDPQGFAK